MSKRYFLTNSTAPYTPTTKRGTWNDSSATLAQLLGDTLSSTAANAQVSKTSATNPYNVLLGRFVSAPIPKSGVLAGDLNFLFGFFESNAAMNAFSRVHVYVTQGDSDTVRGTLLSNSQGTVEIPTTAGSQLRSAAISSLTVQAGDRIVVEVGYQAQTTNTTYNARLYYGSTNTNNELPEGNNSVTTLSGWMEFTDTNGVLNPVVGTDAQVRSSSYGFVDVNDVVMSYPPEMQSSDFLLAYTTSDEDSVAGGIPAQPPAGSAWVQIGTTKSLATVGTAQVWGRAAGSSSGTETWVGGNFASGVSFLAIANVDPADAIDAALQWAAGSGTAITTHTAVGVSPTSPKPLLINGFFTNNQGTANNQSTPAGMYEWVDTQPPLKWIGQGVYSEQRSASGATGTRVSLTQSSARWFAFSIALKTTVRLTATVTDDFGGGSLNSQWSPSGSPSVSGGKLNITAVSGSYGGIFTDDIYRFQGSSHLAEVIPATTHTGGTYLYSGISVYASGFADFVRIYADTIAGVVWMYSFVGGSQLWGTNIPFDATNHRWMRIRESGGTVYFDTSPNGSTWTQRYSNTLPTTLQGNTCVVDCLVGTDATGVGVTSFDNVNLSPTFTTHDGAASLTATGALAAQVRATFGAAVSLTAACSLTAAGVRVVLPTLSMSAVTALVDLGTIRTVPASADLSASGSLSGVLGVGASAALAASGALGALARLTNQSGTGAAASAALSAAANQQHAVSSNQSAAGAMSVSSTRTVQAQVSFTAAGGLTGSMGRTQAASANLAAVAALYPDGSITDLHATGSLSATASQGHKSDATISASGSLVADASQDWSTGAADLAGTGVLSANASRVHPMLSAQAAAGALVADGRRVHPMVSQVSAHGDLNAVGTRVHAASAAFAAFGNLQARPSQEVGGSLNVSIYVVNRATGALSAKLTDFESLTLSPILNESGAIELRYPKYGKNFELLHANVTEDRDVEVEIWLNGRNGSAFRGILMDSAGDDVEENSVWTFTGVLLNHLMTEIVVYPQPLDEKKELVFAAATAGKVIRTVVQQAQARGALVGVTLGFSDTTDSNGQPWSQVVTSKFSPGTTGKAVLDKLVDLGLVEWEITAGRVLRAYKPGTYGIDHTLGSDPLVLRRGAQIPEAPRKHTVRDSATAMLAAGSEGIYATTQDNTAATRRGRRVEGFASANNLEEEAGVLSYAQTALTSSSTGTMELTQALEFTPGDPRPGAAYNVGDWVFVNVLNRFERLRIKQWSLTVDKDGAAGTISLNDLIAERAVKLQRQLEALTNGTATVGTSTPDDDTGIPVAPIGVTVQSAPYTGPVGEALVSVQVGWDDVDTNVDGTAATDVSGYNVEYKYDSGITQTDWFPAGSTAQTSFTFGNITAGETIVVRVQTVDRANNVSDWSVPVIHICLTDTTPPSIPSNPLVDNYLGVLRVKWDGKTSIGGDPELNFDHLEVHVSTSSAFDADATTLFGTLNAAGGLVYTDGAYGTTYFFRFVAVNTTGLKSAQSGTGFAIPEQVLGSDVFNGAIGTVKLADAAITNAKIADLAVTSAKIQNLDVGKLTAGTFSATMTVSGVIQTAATGNRMLIDNSGWTAYNSSGTVFARLNILNSTFLMTGQYQTAMTGQRIVLNPTGSLQDNIYLYPTAGGDFARIMVRTAPADGSAAVLIDGGAASGNGRGRLGAYKNEAFISWVTGDTGGDTSAGYSRTAVTCTSTDIGVWAQGKIRFAKYSGSSALAGSTLDIKWVSGSTPNAPVISGFDADAAIKLDDTFVCATNAAGNTFYAFKGNGFLTTSTGEAKTDIIDIREAMSPLDVIRSARSRAYYLTNEVEDPAIEAPIRFGPIAEELPEHLQMESPRADGSGSELSVNLTDQIGTLWGAVNQIDDQEIVSTSAFAQTTSELLPGSTVEVPVEWESHPPAAPTGGFAIASNPFLTAWIKTGSATASGCVVVIKNMSAESITDPITASVVGLGLFSPEFVPA